MPEEALAPRRMELKVTRGKFFNSKTELEWRFLLRGAARSHVFFPDARRGNAEAAEGRERERTLTARIDALEHGRWKHGAAGCFKQAWTTRLGL